MDVTGDDLAGVVDLFGALTRAELADALAELAFKAGEDHDPAVFEPVIDDALRTYHLVAVGSDALEGSSGPAGDEKDGAGDEGAGTGDEGAVAGDEMGEDGHGGGGLEQEAVLVPGPVAFPQLPEGSTDLPHILEVGERSVDRDLAGRAAEERFRSDAASAVGAGDRERIAELLDVSYELEVWAPVDLEAARARLDGALEE